MTASILKNLLSLTFVLFLLCDATAQETPVQELDQYGGVTSLKGRKTGWFHVEEIAGRWFFVTPEGNAFFSLGVTHAVDCVRKDELGLFESKFGKDQSKLSEFILERTADWGYNTAGYGALVPMEKKIPYVAAIWTEGPRSMSAWKHSKNTDIFEPTTQERLRGNVRNSATRHVDNPFCLGYVFIDLPVWHPTGAGRKGAESYVEFIRGLSPDAAGRKAYAAFLKKQFNGNVMEFARAYGIEASSFDSLSKTELSKVQVRKNQKVAADDELFLNQIRASMSVLRVNIRRNIIWMR